MADLKPIYKRVNGEWVKQTAFQRTNGEWVKISEANEPTTTYTVSGVWVFYDNIYLDYNKDTEATVKFTSNSTSFTKMTARMGYGLYYNESRVYSPPTWTNNAYKTVDFGTTPQEVSKTFYEWLTANANKQIKFYFYTDSSTLTRTAYEGMTWEEWIDSEFNSSGTFGLSGKFVAYITTKETYYVVSKASNGITEEKVYSFEYIQEGVTYRKGEKKQSSPSKDGGSK